MFLLTKYVGKPYHCGAILDLERNYNYNRDMESLARGTRLLNRDTITYSNYLNYFNFAFLLKIAFIISIDACGKPLSLLSCRSCV